MDLPASILVKSDINSKYLRYRKEDDSSHGFLQFSQEEKDEKVEFRYVKFEVEKAETEGFVHIRSCYNNKYWVRKSADNNSIVAEANEPEEDQSKLSCTLFKAVLVEQVDTKSSSVSVGVPQAQAQKIRLMHIDQLGQHYTCVTKSPGDDAYGLAVGEADADADADTRSKSEVGYGDVFTVFNASSYVILPEYVAFMGNNDQYCAVTTVSGVNYLEFRTTDIGTWGTSNRIIQNAVQQFTAITNDTTSDYWRISDPYLVVSNRGFLETFTPISLGGNVIALRCQTNDRFAHSVSGQGLQSIMGNQGRSIDSTARFRVAEPVSLREINNVVYNIADSRIYNVSSVQKYSDTRRNFTSVEQSGLFNVNYKTSQSTSWNDSVSVTTGITASWSFSIPYVGEFGVELSNERTESREWGVEKVEEEEVTYEQSLTIPPGKQVTLTVVATRAFCDVPFTCNVTDTMTSGTIRSYRKTDGLFEGSNEFNFLTEIREQDI